MDENEIKFNKAQRQAYLRSIDLDALIEAVLEQMNSLRMQKVNLVNDMDVLVNDYLKVCKKHPIK